MFERSYVQDFDLLSLYSRSRFLEDVRKRVVLLGGVFYINRKFVKLFAIDDINDILHVIITSQSSKNNY